MVNEAIARPLAWQALVALLNFALLVALTVTFITMHRRSKAPFTRGLVAFAGVLALQALFRVIFLLSLAGVPIVRPAQAFGLDFLADLAMLVSIGWLLVLVNR